MLEKAQAVALGAGRILLDKARAGFDVEHKGSIDLVTDADRAAEEYVVQELKKHFPTYSILAEEGGFIAGAEEYIWVIDPLDGTTNFAHRFLHYAVSIALARKGKILLGVVYNPVLDECFSAQLGKGAYLNGQRISVSSEKLVLNSLLATGFPYDVATTAQDNMLAFERAMKASQGVRSMGAAALDLCQVACGRLEGFWERDLQPWDIAAGSLIVAEAGGEVSTCRGGAFDPLGSEILASNGRIHGELLKMVKV